MKNTTISVQIPENVYIGLKQMAKEDMRSARNYISRLIIQNVPEKYLPKKLEEKKPVEEVVQGFTEPNSNCINCGVYVHLRPYQFEAAGKLCTDCRKKKYA